MRSRVLKLFIFILTAVVGLGRAPAAEDFAGWPEDWVLSYKRFEKFIVAQQESALVADITVSPDGWVQSSLPKDVERKSLTLVAYFRNGARALEPHGGGPGFSFSPGTYAVCLHRFEDTMGYQYIHPVRWFQVEQGKKEPGDVPNEGPVTIRMIDTPQPETDYWPNDRLLRYWDFQVLPRINPLKFFRENNKVSPKATIAVTRHGMVQREKMDDALEPLLRWRIYYEGKLVESGSAAGDLQYTPKHGVGSYVAFIGVEGPNGFMPVSNLLQFPLFTERDGSFAVTPSVTNPEGLPDFIFDLLTPDELDQLREVAAKFEKGPRGSAMTYGLGSIRGSVDPKKKALFDLWSAWEWNVNLARASQMSDIGRINILPEPK